MHIALYTQLIRTLTPCTGVGRHCNEVGLALARRSDVGATLVVSKEHCSDFGTLPENAPLKALDQVYHSMPEAHSEKVRKLTGMPVFDGVLPDKANWLYCPHDTRLNSNRCRTAITIHDARVFEPELRNVSWRDDVADKIMRTWMRRAANDANLVFTVSSFSKQRLCELLQLPDEKVVSVGNGITCSFNSSMPSDGVSPGGHSDRRTAIVIGGLRYVKGGDRVLALAKALRAQKSNIKILSIGGPDEPDLAAEADRIGNIERLGFIPDQELITLMSNALTTLNCSRYEGFGLPTLESMSLGVPVIAQNETSLPEVVGEGGFLIDTDRTAEVVEIIEKLKGDQNFFTDYRKRGLTQASKFNWDNVAARICDSMSKYDSKSLYRST
ncbi:MAG: glycosyltransferase family 1 protein [Pseudomonadota bacterium]